MKLPKTKELLRTYCEFVGDPDDDVCDSLAELRVWLLSLGLNAVVVDPVLADLGRCAGYSPPSPVRRGS